MIRIAACNRGYAALLSTLIIAAALLASTLSLFALSYLARSSAFAEESRKSSEVAAASCISAALRIYGQGRNVLNGPETLMLDRDRSCVIDAIDQISTSTTIRAHASSQGSMASIEAVIVPSDTDPGFKIVSWRDI